MRKLPMAVIACRDSEDNGASDTDSSIVDVTT
jgi:hypothetical protein